MVFDKDTIEEIKRMYGLPCYVFDESAFCLNYNHLLSAMRSRYPKYEIAYSYKTNYAPAICSIVKKMGGYAEVVSDMEHDIAEKIGYQCKHIIYNGPFKGHKLKTHLLNDGIVNIDNLEEVDRIIAIAEQYKKELKLGIRVNIQVGQSFVSRFGIDIDSSDICEAVNRINKCIYTKLVGLHCHIGRSRGLDAWKSRTIQILKLADQYIKDIPEYLDLGSGMFGDIAPDMLEQFSTNIPSYEDYAEVTALIVNDHYKSVPKEKKPVLFTEPGTTLDNRYIDLIAQIHSIKTIKNKDLAILNCSVHNLGDVSGSVKLPIKVIENSVIRSDYQQIDLVGYTCLERDVPYQDFSGKLGKDDYVVFGNVGGYSNVDKPPFILPQCAMIGVCDRKTYLIKRKETTDDILDTYIL